MRPKAESLLRAVVMAALISVAVAGCGAAVTGSSQTPPAGFAGYRWQVVEIDHAGRQTPVPARYAVYLQFGLTGQFGAHEPVNYHGGSYHSTSDGFTTSGMSSTLVGYAGHDPVVLLSVSAISAFGDGVPATVRLAGDRLTVSVGDYLLRCQRDGRQAGAAPASPA